MSATTQHGRRSLIDIAGAIQGRHLDVTRDVAGIPAKLLDGKHHPCPKCFGTDRFRMIDQSKGAVLCSKCFSSENGDSIAAVQWMRGVSYSDALQLIGEYLGVARVSNGHSSRDIVAEVAAAKRMPVEAFKQFGAAPAKRGKLTVARVPAFDEYGERSTEFDLTASGKGWFKKGAGAGVFLPGKKPVPGETWCIVEGVKDAAALVGLGYLAMGLPTCRMAAKFSRLVDGCHVVLIPDLDSAGQDGADQTASRILKVAASVRVARLPGEIKAKDGADVRDCLQAAEGVQRVREAIKSAKAWEPTSEAETDDDRPEVELSLDESKVVADVLPLVGNLGWTLQPQSDHLRTYQRSGGLFHVVTDATAVANLELPDDARRIRPLPSSLLRERITAGVRLFTDVETQDGLKREYKRPPDWLVKMIHERGEYPRTIRPITAVVTSPTMRPDGSLVQASGYDDRTGLLVEITGEWPEVSDQPTRDDARRASAELLEVVSEFPFISNAHRSAWLSLVLTMVGRPAIRGTVPLFVVEANTPGTGKSLSVTAAGIIATGTDLPAKAYSGDDEEMRKTITAVALESLPVVLLDNVSGRLGNASLDAALTANTWSDRILGQSRTSGSLPLTTVWIATGNNIELTGDIPRRTLLMRLVTDMERPEERTGFRHGELKQWVGSERRRFVAAALTILRAFVVAGRPDQGLAPWGSFEPWSGLVRNAIVWAGLADPGDTRQVVRAADHSANLLQAVIKGIEEAGNEATLAELIRLATRHVEPGQPDEYPILRSAVAELCGDKVTTARLGAKLRSYVGRVCCGKRLARFTSNGITAWTVETLIVSGHGGHSGHSPSPFTREKNSIHQETPAPGDTPAASLERPPECPLCPPCPLDGAGNCPHEPHEYTTFDGFIRTECGRCGALLNPDRRPEVAI